MAICIRQSPPTSTDFRLVLRYFPAVLRPRAAEALALVDRASAIVYRGIASEAHRRRGLPGDEGGQPLKEGGGAPGRRFYRPPANMP